MLMEPFSQLSSMGKTWIYVQGSKTKSGKYENIIITEASMIAYKTIYWKIWQLVQFVIIV
jgi:hypothetical protein